MPENTVSVCRPGRFGNPFMVGPDRTQRQAVECFRAWLTTPYITAGIPEKKQAILDGLESIRGKNLACFCQPGTACHADVLLDLANTHAEEHDSDSSTDIKDAPQNTDRDSVESADLLVDLDYQVDQALEHQRRLTRETEILQAKCEVAGEYRVKFMDLRDKLRAKISSTNTHAEERDSDSSN